jgi:predicted dehydrogenase
MTNQDKVRWGILGGARINQQLMPAIVSAHNSELVAIASRRPGAAKETLSLYAPEEKGVRIFNHFEDLLADETIQAVYIPLSNSEHAHWTLKALETGKHVLCEKPMALTVTEIDAIQNIAQRKNLKVMEGFMYRFHPQHTRVHDIIASGDLGEIRSVRACFSFMIQPSRHYRLKAPINNGGGALWDIGCYAIHAARLPFGVHAPESVIAMTKFAENGADLSSSGIMDFGQGRYAQFAFSFEHARRAEYEIIGTLGGLKCHNVWAKPTEEPVISWWTETDGPQPEETLPTANHFQLEVEHFSDCILHDTEPQLSLEDAKTNCNILVAAIESATQGTRIRLK